MNNERKRQSLVQRPGCPRNRFKPVEVLRGRRGLAWLVTRERIVNDSANKITFKCSSCEHPLVIETDNPPNDEDIICCRGCGKEFGSYAKVKEAALVLAEAEFDSLIEEDLPLTKT
jgi:hypothetical protein